MKFQKNLWLSLSLGLCLTLTASLGMLATMTAQAGEADVIKVAVKPLGDNRYRIDVTVEHADAGWEHYANVWEVLGPDGELLGTRVLAHPHDNEQPFTRSLTVTIPSTVNSIRLRAGDSVHEFGGKELIVDLPSV